MADPGGTQGDDPYAARIAVAARAGDASRSAPRNDATVATLADPSRRRLLTGAAPHAGPLVHVASFVVRAFPAQLPAVLANVEARGVFEVVAAQDSRLVLVAETASERHIVDHLSDLELIPGVLGALLVYHHVETAEQLDEPIPAAVAEVTSDAADPT